MKPMCIYLENSESNMKFSHRSLLWKARKGPSYSELCMKNACYIKCIPSISAYFNIWSVLKGWWWNGCSYDIPNMLKSIEFRRLLGLVHTTNILFSRKSWTMWYLSFFRIIVHKNKVWNCSTQKYISFKNINPILSWGDTIRMKYIQHRTSIHKDTAPDKDSCVLKVVALRGVGGLIVGSRFSPDRNSSINILCSEPRLISISNTPPSWYVRLHESLLRHAKTQSCNPGEKLLFKMQQKCCEKVL